MEVFLAFTKKNQERKDKGDEFFFKDSGPWGSLYTNVDRQFFKTRVLKHTDTLSTNA